MTTITTKMFATDRILGTMTDITTTAVTIRVALDDRAVNLITTTTEAMITIGAYPTTMAIIDVQIKDLGHGADLLTGIQEIIVGTRGVNRTSDITGLAEMKPKAIHGVRIGCLENSQ